MIIFSPSWRFAAVCLLVLTFVGVAYVVALLIAVSR